jgi:hypothetical protein
VILVLRCAGGCVSKERGEQVAAMSVSWEGAGGRLMCGNGGQGGEDSTLPPERGEWGIEKEQEARNTAPVF